MGSPSTTPPGTKSPPSATLPEKIPALRRYTWSLTTMVWKVLCAALLPLGLAEISTLLPKIAEHLARYDPHRNRESALERCRRRWAEDLTEALE